MKKFTELFITVVLALAFIGCDAEDADQELENKSIDKTYSNVDKGSSFKSLKKVDENISYCEISYTIGEVYVTYDEGFKDTLSLYCEKDAFIQILLPDNNDDLESFIALNDSNLTLNTSYMDGNRYYSFNVNAGEYYIVDFNVKSDIFYDDIERGNQLVYSIDIYDSEFVREGYSDIRSTSYSFYHYYDGTECSKLYEELGYCIPLNFSSSITEDGNISISVE
jgi:hypothetical protein